MMEMLIKFLEASPIWATVVICAVIVLSIIMKWNSGREQTLMLTKTTDAVDSTLSNLQHNLDENLDRLIRLIEEAPEKADQISRVQLLERIDGLEKSVSDLRELLFGNPDDAVRLPLLQKDIASLKLDIENQNKRIELVSSYSKWLIGLMLTLAVGVLGLAISIILKFTS